MTTWLRFTALACACLIPAVVATAQTSESAAEGDDTRQATTTFMGDTGLWFVPTAEVLASGKWSVSGYRRGTNYVQGFTNVGDFAGTFAVGLGNRVEIFGSYLFDTRIDRDMRPLFVNDSTVGGVIDRYPAVSQPWTGNNPGDFYAGVKFNLLSEFRDQPLALAVRAMVKAPAGDQDVGNSTGKTDFIIDLIASRETRSRMLEYSGYVGYEVRGEPDGFDAPGGALRWGAGVGFPSRGPLRGVFELDGILPNGDTLTLTDAVIACVDCGVPPVLSNIEKSTRATVGLNVQLPGGFFVGGGLSMNLPREDREAFGVTEDAFGDFADWQVRLGFHPGVRRNPREVSSPAGGPGMADGGAGAPGAGTGTLGAGAASPGAGAPGAGPGGAGGAGQAGAANRPPTIQARCEPCVVETGATSTVTADAQDPDGDLLTYRWSGPSGTFQNPSDRQTAWTAPQQEGGVPLTVTVDDGRGGTASAQVTVQVVRSPIAELTFEDVYFDFDRSSLRSEAQRLLDDAVAKLQANPDRNLIIEGHTCNIGTAEYNLALGDRRASSVRDYLTSRGVAPGRIEVRSYGEERPRHDNAREETRRLNRRAALVVTVQ
jgi:outer membrane protein OmpA-like peptidoglycan-associated protein